MSFFHLIVFIVYRYFAFAVRDEDDFEKSVRMRFFCPAAVFIERADV